MLQESRPKQALLAKANGRRPVGRRRTVDSIITLKILQNDGCDGRP